MLHLVYLIFSIYLLNISNSETFGNFVFYLWARVVMSRLSFPIGPQLKVTHSKPRAKNADLVRDNPSQLDLLQERFNWELFMHITLGHSKLIVCLTSCARTICTHFWKNSHEKIFSFSLIFLCAKLSYLCSFFACAHRILKNFGHQTYN